MSFVLNHINKWMVLAVFTVWTSSTLAQQRFEGYTYDDQKVALPFAHLVNLTQSVGTVSGSNGFFTIQADIGDSVRFSFIGYKNLILVVTEEMLDREVNITLQPDYIELPSIWVFSNPKYKVPKKPILPSFRMGPLPETKNQKNIQPGDVTFKLIDKMEIGGITVPILSPSVTLHGPFTYFTKEEREKRKAEEAYLSTYETLSFAKLMALKQTRDLLKNRYELDDSELDRLIVMMNRELPLIQKIQEPTKIFASVDQYIGRKRVDVGFLNRP